MSNTSLVKGKLYRLGVERPTQGVRSKGSYKWETYIPRAALYRNTYSKRALFAGLGNKDMIGDVFRNDLVVFLEESDTWVRLLVDDRVGWIQKTDQVGYRIALCSPDIVFTDGWTRTQEGSLISWSRPNEVGEFLLPWKTDE